MNLDVFYQSNSAHFGRKPLFEGDIKRKGTSALSKKQEEKPLDKYLKEKQTIRHQFARFAKMVLAGEANKQKKEYARRSLYEATFFPTCHLKTQRSFTQWMSILRTITISASKDKK